MKPVFTRVADASSAIVHEDNRNISERHNSVAPQALGDVETENADDYIAPEMFTDRVMSPPRSLSPKLKTEWIEHALHLSEDRTVRVLVENVPDRPACVMVFGRPLDGSLVRVHSRCLYGDVFASNDCDCGLQLQMSLDMIEQEGRGIVIYLDQEGRSCGLANKARGYRVTQSEGLDTFEAYASLGLPPDARDYSSAIEALQFLNLGRIRLLTCNPDKVHAVRSSGIAVEPIPLVAEARATMAAYLAAKRMRGHSL